MDRTAEFPNQRLLNGMIDFDHYRRLARRSRRLAIRRTARSVARWLRRSVQGFAFTLAAAKRPVIDFWNIPPLGTAGGKRPYFNAR